MINRGDRVKLIARKRPNKLTDRRGVVERITNNKANAVVLWDGRKSTEYVPIRSSNPNQQKKMTGSRGQSRNCHRTLALPFDN